MSNMQKHTCEIDELVCVDPEIGALYLHDYLAGTLTEPQKQQFENHLFFCLKCREELEYMRWAVQQLKQHATRAQTSGKASQQGLARPLQISSVLDGNAHNLIHDFYEKPLMDRLAASAETSLELSFPITLEYENGEVVGQFRKRAGYLFYKLQKSSLELPGCAYTLTYTSRINSFGPRIFEIKPGEDKCIGDFAEIVPSNTIQGMLEAIRQFQLSLRPKE